jgi:hypothetical protein
MGSPQSTSIRRGIVALAAALLLAVLAAAAGAATPAPEPPPVSCITDNPVDPLGPGFLLSRGKFTTINHPKATLETAPYGINNRGQIVGGYDTPGFIFQGFLLDRGRYKTIAVPGPCDLQRSRSTPADRSWVTTRTPAAAYKPTTWPRLLMPNGKVSEAPGTSIVV